MRVRKTRKEVAVAMKVMKLILSLQRWFQKFFLGWSSRNLNFTKLIKRQFGYINVTFTKQKKKIYIYIYIYISMLQKKKIIK